MCALFKNQYIVTLNVLILYQFNKFNTLNVRSTLSPDLRKDWEMIEGQYLVMACNLVLD